MRIAITQRVVTNATYPETRDALSQEWPVFLGSVAERVIPLPVPNILPDPAAWARELAIQALVLSGGNDWGDAPGRDACERALFEYARAAGIPVLGVCRGLQVINLLLGGSLCRDLSSATAVAHAGTAHAVDLAGDSFAALAGGRRVLQVNSFHRQGVLRADLAAQLAAFAEAPDGVVEGVAHRFEPILAIQWHPERPSPSAEFDRALVRSLFGRRRFWEAGMGTEAGT